MKQLICLSFLLLVGPSLASAQAAQHFNVTSGSMDHIFNSDFPYTIAGPGFSSSGDIMNDFPTVADEPIGPGSLSFIVSGNAFDDELAPVSLTVHGVPWDFPDTFNTEGGAFSAFEATVLFGAHPGIYHSTFTFFGDWVGGPASAVAADPESCDPFNCIHLSFSGSGTATWDLIPDPNFPGLFDISHVSFTFKSPEPSTASLLFIGFAGLVLLGRRRRSRVTMLQMG